MTTARHMTAAYGAVTLDGIASRCISIVMAGLVPTLHELTCAKKNVDAGAKPGHDVAIAVPCIA